MNPNVATWLKETRLRQVDPATGKPWSQARLAELVTAETGWTLLRENYSRYESGATTPNPETLARFVAFWEAHGEAGPDLTPPEPVASVEERTYQALVASNERLAAILEAQVSINEQLVRRLDALETLMLRTSEPTPTQVDEDAQAWAEAADTTSPSPRPARPAGRG